MVKQPTKGLTADSYTKPPSESRETIGDIDKELVNYIFAKIKLTWGEGLYESQFGEDKQLRIVKRDWAVDLLTALSCRRYANETEDEYAFRAKTKLDQIFSEIRQQMTDGKSTWEFPSLKRICSYMANRITTAAHKPFRPDRSLEDQGAKERAREAGAKALAEMKASLGLK